jgi:hypothetical protein
MYGGGFGPIDPYFTAAIWVAWNPQVGPPLTVDPFTGQLVPWNPWLVTPMPYIGVTNQYPGFDSGSNHHQHEPVDAAFSAINGVLHNDRSSHAGPDRSGSSGV